MEILTLPVGTIHSGTSGVEITNLIKANSRHYNITVKKEGEFYIINAERAEWEIYLGREYDPMSVDLVVDKHVKMSKPCLFGLIPGKRYISGWVELKKREQIEIKTNNITIYEREN